MTVFMTGARTMPGKYQAGMATTTTMPTRRHTTLNHLRTHAGRRPRLNIPQRRLLVQIFNSVLHASYHGDEHGNSSTARLDIMDKSDRVIKVMAQRAAADFNFQELMRIVAYGKATIN